MDSIILSIIIPIYNVEEYLEACLTSVVKQTLDHLQVIMLDDGSTDASSEIAKSFARKYDYFDYIYQPNGGTGNARNSGAKYAKGSYLVFLDADDIVPPDAYEKLYHAAERNHSDITIGNVIRFNSKRELPSQSHQAAFQNIVDKTHLNQDANLFYDATIWNKLIRKDFWERHRFQFPDGMLYEDIPVTIPMHYLANHVSVIHDVCYLWRIRDGVSKSITQRAAEDKNFHDRLRALRLVDAFFEAKVTNLELHHQKKLKWLRSDLMILINTMLFQNDDVIAKRSQEIKAYICETIPANIIEELPAIARHKYHYLFDGEISKLKRLREYELSGYGDIKITKKRRQYFARFPKGLLAADSCDMGTTLARRQLRQAMYRIRPEDGCYIIEGYVFLPALSITRKSQQFLKASLLRLESNEKIPLQIENRYTFKPTRSFGLKVNNEYRQLKLINYSGSGYRLVIRLQEDIIDNKLQGEYKVLLEYERDCWKHQVFLSGTEKAVRNRKISTIIEDRKIDLEIMKKKVLQIAVNKLQHVVKESQLCDNKLRIMLSQTAAQYGFRYGDGTLEKAAAAIAGSSIEIPCDGIPDERVELGVLNGNRFTALCWKENFRSVRYVDNGQLLEQSLSNYHYLITARENAANIIAAVQVGAVIEMTISRTDISLAKAADCYLFFDDPLIAGRTVIASGATQCRQHKIISRFTVNLENPAITNNLYQRKRQLFICYKGDREMIDPIYGMDKAYKFNFSTKTRKHQIQLNNADALILNTTLRKGYFDRSEKKRSISAGFIYPLFRMLPLRRKIILFEAMAGAVFDGSPKALYEHIEQTYPQYICVWSLKDECIPISGNGLRVRKWSLRYFYYLARAKYLVNNADVPNEYVPRKKQIKLTKAAVQMLAK